MTVIPQARGPSLDDLSNEVLEQIVQYIQHWSRLPPRLSVYGVLSRVSRRLRAFALPLYFSTVCIPVKMAALDACVMKARPLMRLNALFDNLRYKQYVKNLTIGSGTYPTSPWINVDPDATEGLGQYSCEFLNMHPACPWDLRSFVSLSVSCGPPLIRLLHSSSNLRILSMRWHDASFPDLSHFPQLDTLRLVGQHCITICEDRGRYLTKPTGPHPSLRYLAFHGAVHIPRNLVEELHELYPRLRVLVAMQAPFAPQDILRMVSRHHDLEEVSAEFQGIDLEPQRCRLDNLVNVMCGRTYSWPPGLPATISGPGPSHAASKWARIKVVGFAFVRKRRGSDPSQYGQPPYNVSSLALRCTSQESENERMLDTLRTLLVNPVGFPYRQIRHLSVSVHEPGFRRDEYVEDFLAKLGTVLAHWPVIETFTLHHDIVDKQWPEGAGVPVLDDADIPSQISDVYYGSNRTLGDCLAYLDDDAIEKVVEELSRILGREVSICDGDIDIDKLWMERNERTMERAVRKLAQRCTTLRKFHWFVCPLGTLTSWAYRILRGEDPRRPTVVGRRSYEGCLSGEMFPFTAVVGQELRAAKNGWTQRSRYPC
ncbi:hypothetical protein GGF50DRAFT_102947 [Schizophyllum commune]